LTGVRECWLSSHASLFIPFGCNCSLVLVGELSIALRVGKVKGSHSGLIGRKVELVNSEEINDFKIRSVVAVVMI
jgi:hypothetical protein